MAEKLIQEPSSTKKRGLTRREVLIGAGVAGASILTGSAIGLGIREIRGLDNPLLTGEQKLEKAGLGEFAQLYRDGNRFLQDFGFMPEFPPFINASGINIIDTLRFVAGDIADTKDNDFAKDRNTLQKLWGVEQVPASMYEDARQETLQNVWKLGEQHIKNALYTLQTRTDYHQPGGVDAYKATLQRLNLVYPAPFAVLAPEVRIWDGLGGLYNKDFIMIPSFLQNPNIALRDIVHELTHNIQDRWREIVPFLPKKEVATYLQVIVQEVSTHLKKYYDPSSTWTKMRYYNRGNPIVGLYGIGQSNPETTIEQVEALEQKFASMIGIDVNSEYTAQDIGTKKEDETNITFRWNRLAYFVGKKYFELRNIAYTRKLTDQEEKFYHDYDLYVLMERVAYEISHIFVDPPLEGAGSKDGIFGTRVGVRDTHPLTLSGIKVFTALTNAFCRLPANQPASDVGQEIRDHFALADNA